jgi:hypothetical protein
MFKSLFLLMFFMALAVHAGAAELQTALEESGWTQLTGYEQLMDYLERLDSSSENVSVEVIGTSVEGRSIPALFFTSDGKFASRRGEKPVVIVFCQQHGNEPSGKEAALIVARSLLDENGALLERLDLVLIPQVNPDGSELGQRHNANDMDLNRNHVILSEPESMAVHRLFLDWMPEITLDVHEYNAVLERWIQEGYIKDADEMIGGVTNLNIDPEIMRFSRDVFIPQVGLGVEADGFRFHRYIVGEPFEEKVVRYSTTAINDGRQSLGIYNTLSFIIEGKRYGNLTNELERRTKGQVSAITRFLETAARNAGEALAIVNRARADMSGASRSYIQMDYYSVEDETTLDFPVFDINSWTHTTRELPFFKSRVKVKKSVAKPAAYAFAATQSQLLELLKRHRLPLRVVQGDQPAETETYLVNHVTETVDEEKPAFLIDLEKTVQTETLRAGTIVVPVTGAAANLVPLMLEPESTWGIVTQRAMHQQRFGDYLAEGQPYPVKRLASLEGLVTRALEY